MLLRRCEHGLHIDRSLDGKDLSKASPTHPLGRFAARDTELLCRNSVGWEGARRRHGQEIPAGRSRTYQPNPRATAKAPAILTTTPTHPSQRWHKNPLAPPSIFLTGLGK